MRARIIWRRRLQRAFSTFPGGFPGTGLLLLRIIVGVALIADSVLYLLDRHNSPSFALVLAVVMLLSGILLLVGYLTPLAGTLAALACVGRMSSWLLASGATPLDTRWAIVFEITIAIALALLGPGAFSFDARLYGRREIIIPRSPFPPS